MKTKNVELIDQFDELIFRLDFFNDSVHDCLNSLAEDFDDSSIIKGKASGVFYTSGSIKRDFEALRDKIADTLLSMKGQGERAAVNM